MQELAVGGQARDWDQPSTAEQVVHPVLHLRGGLAAELDDVRVEGVLAGMAVEQQASLGVVDGAVLG
ncbi:hypothetical protein [Nonomuraea dietziae]|uniref:Uncharacterized protein n=1 Tax=Nonomuraea dietziae TaxID=65515 RepID=A0A7W5VLB0_9ACTN|nr:hypothetical protein [Nonomuraea dietziae]MBB3733744.1 hypothetical protein [Nonomuraea dietziae]